MKRLQNRYYLVVLVSLLSFMPVYAITARFACVKRSNCAPAVVEFTNLSTTGTGITYTWDFGLGGVVTATDASAKMQVYTNPGQYTVSLIVTKGSEKDTMTEVVVIAKGPSASFTATPLYGCAPLTVTYTSTSAPGGSDITGIVWDFRNGDQDYGKQVSYTYETSGRHGVLLKVTDVNGCYSIVESDSLIQAVAKPEVNFRASDTFACEPPLNVTFVNQSTGATSLTYLWDFGNGKKSTGLSNSSVYNTSGNYDVKLTATDQYSCKDSLTMKSYIIIGNQKGTLMVTDAANDTITGTGLCKGIYKFRYSVNSLPDYTWIIHDNGHVRTFSGSDSLEYSVTGSGTLGVTLLYGDNSMCTDSISQWFTKYNVKADFAPDTSIFCGIPVDINFRNKSTDAVSYSWYLANKWFSNATDTSYRVTQADLPVETYSQKYSHDVNTATLPFKLVAVNVDGCADSVTRDVVVSLPVARFMPDLASGCAPLQVTFSDSSKSDFDIDQYTYIIKNEEVISTSGGPVTYTFETPGKYGISEVIKSGGCIDTSYAIVIQVGKKLTPDFTVIPAKVCNGGEIHLAGNTENYAAVSSWRFISQDLFDIQLNAKPDTVITVYTDSAGFRNIILEVDYNGCISDTLKKNAFEIAGPVGNLTETFACDSPLVYTFKSDFKPATSLTWAIDTLIAKDVDSVHYKYAKSGNDTVRLTVLDASSGCTFSIQKLVAIRNVDAEFTLSDTVFCVGDSVKLNASKSVDNVNSCYNEGFLWGFGDDSPPRRTYIDSTAHVYTSKGSYQIKLYAKADNGCIDSTEKKIQVFRPEGSFTADRDSGCLSGFKVTFANTSTDSTILSWVWDYGDKSATDSNTIKAVHGYSGEIAQSFYPSLTVYDAYQCYSNAAMAITLIDVSGDFQADDNAICLGETVQFTPADFRLDSLYWNFGDGSTSLNNSIHAYLKQGNYNVTLVGVKAGCRDTVTMKNYVGVEEANANFTLSDSVLNCYPDTVSLVHNNSIGSPAVSRQWKFNSQTLGEQDADSVSYVFTKPGNYLISLVVKTLNGCRAENSKNLLIKGPSVRCSFSPESICYGDSVYFSLDSVGNTTQWAWMFGDGSTSSESTVYHTFTSRGELVPAVLLINDDCNTTVALDTLTVSSVRADFTSADSSLTICYGDNLDLVNHSTSAVSWTWEVGGVSTSTDYDLNGIEFSKPGNYTVRLTVDDENHCSDTLSKVFSVVSPPDVVITGDSVLCSASESAVLTVNSESGWTVQWTPKTGLSNPDAFTTTASPSKSTTYTALVTDAHGCSAGATKYISVGEPVDLSRVPTGDTIIYLGEKLQLQVTTSADGVTYSWTPNYNITCRNCSDPWVSPAASTTYQVKLENDCFDHTESFHIEVITDFYLKAPTAFAPNGNGYNEEFLFESKNIKTFHLEIFNRWGQMVFSTDDVTQGWDGKFNGHDQNIDTYVYTVKAETVHGYQFEMKGTVLLIR
jgi:gliding motility-associated-like protein